MEREHLIEFTQVVVKKASTSEHMLNRVMPRDNIALCAVLRIKENVYNNRRMTMAAADNVVGSPLVVCTAHIHWDPELCDVKLVQTLMLAHELYRLLEEVAEQFRITPQQTPVLICGDFNSLPDSGDHSSLHLSGLSLASNSRIAIFMQHFFFTSKISYTRICGRL
ncbi:unnamed protein product [Cylicostephanus goldi]|uniref:Endonuclease/exonuclease/phosphatase domain-containing protein n=1 Tax=Cylicostephanus goldi TaxID=71465 RepID=A0A3P6S540_CYLGO|nr:unnamed protein product [Cylicostephanus goldi]